MMNKLMFFAFFTCTLFLTDVSGAIIQRPLNAATSVGGQTVFNCSNNDPASITWLYTLECDSATGTPLTVNNCDIDSNYASHYTTEKPGSFVCNLIVFDALLSHGGCYACTDGPGTGRFFQAMLIIVDSNASITANPTDLIPGENVNISSSVFYGGPSIPLLSQPPLPPSFYWTLQSDPSQNITSYPGLTTHTSASSYTTVTAQTQNVPPCVCNLFFDLPINVSATVAVNAPKYSISWTTPTYPVSYAPENLAISGTPNPCLHQSTTELICSASGHPTPTYKWFNLTSGSVLSESNTVTIDRGGSYECVASNTIRNVPYNASTTVNVFDCESPQNVSITASSGPCASNSDCGKLNSDSLTCKAYGFPEPEYEWLFSGEKVVGPTVVAKKNIEYQCTATNHYADQPHSASSTLQVNWLTVLICVNVGLSDAVCISLLVIAIYFGLNLLFFTVFIICYGCSQNGRDTLNDRFPWLKKMLPCMNDEGCECSVWIVYFVLLSIFAAFVFFPVILIMAGCCKTKKKTSQGNRQENERNVRGVGGTQLNTLGTGTTPYQYPPRVSVTSNPPSSLNTSANFQQDQTDRPYHPSSTQQHQPTYWGNSDPYPPNPRNLQMPRQTPSPALSSSGVVYADLRVDNQPKSRRPIQPIQNDANTYADIAMA